MVRSYLQKFVVKKVKINLEVNKKVVPLHSHLKNGSLERVEMTSSLKRLIYCTRSKYREIQFIEKR